MATLFSGANNIYLALANNAFNTICTLLSHTVGIRLTSVSWLLLFQRGFKYPTRELSVEEIL